MRSGGGSDGEQPSSLSPDPGQVVAEAQAEMDRLVRLGNLQNDPIRHPIQALSVHLGAFHKLIEAARRPVGDNDIRRLTSPADARNRGPDSWWPVNRRTVLIAMGALMLTFLTGTGAGYWLRGAAAVLVGVHAGAERCEDRPDGSRLCWIPVYERLPATPSGH
jgi:hypothetical protein